MKHRICIFIALIFSAFSLRGETTAASLKYSLEQCYQLTQENYPLVKRYNLIELSETYNLKNAYMKYFPQISISASASIQTDVLTWPVDISIPGFEPPVYSKDQYSAIIELSQVIWDGGQIAAERENIRAKATIEKHEQNIAIYSLREKIDGLYFGLLLLGEQLNQTRMMISELETEVERIKKCIENGVANDSDHDMIEVELITHKQNILNIESKIEAYLRMLSLMTGTKIDSVQMLEYPIAPGTNMEQLLTSILLQDVRRFELDMYDAQIAQIDTQLDYWVASGMPKFKLFVRGGYGRPGLDFLDNSFAPFAIGGITLQWNISELYSLGYGKKVVKFSKQQIESVKETFLFNTSLQSEEQISEVRRLIELLKEDEKIYALRTKIRKSAEVEVENGTMNASDLIREINREDISKKQMILHEIELMKAIYQLKHIRNN